MLSAFRIFAILLIVVPVAAASDRTIGWDTHVGNRSAMSIDVCATGSGEAGFEAAAISWSGEPDSVAVVRLRASADGQIWSSWIIPPFDDDMTDQSSGRYFTAISHFGLEMRYFEYAFEGEPAVRDVNVTMFAPPPERRALDQETQSYMLGNLTIRSRNDWECPEASGRDTPSYTTVTHLVVHHTATSSTVPDWDAELRNIWYYHTVTNGWADIGYNYLIDPNGVIYEGRAGGNGVLGAHFSCRNTNTAGVALLGTYTTVQPSTAAIESLKRLLAELCAINGISPAAVVYHAPTALMLPTILAHRDGNPSPKVCTVTECPGDALYALLPAIRNELPPPAPPKGHRRAVGRR